MQENNFVIFGEIRISSIRPASKKGKGEKTCQGFVTKSKLFIFVSTKGIRNRGHDGRELGEEICTGENYRPLTS